MPHILRQTQRVIVNATPDARLVALVQCGDSEAFEQLAARHRDFTYRLALRIVSRPEDAEDVVQDVWLSVFTHIGRFRAECSFETWIYRIAFNRSLQVKRFRGRSVLDQADSGFDGDRSLSFAAREKSPEDSILLKEQSARLSALLGKLRDKYRRALCLWLLDSMNIEQISRELRISHGAAKTRLHRARLQIKRVAQMSEGGAPPSFTGGSEAQCAAPSAKRKPNVKRVRFAQ